MLCNRSGLSMIIEPILLKINNRALYNKLFKKFNKKMITRAIFILSLMEVQKLRKSASLIVARER
jgi:hypothetical protein